MNSSVVLPLCVAVILILFHGSFAQLDRQQQQPRLSGQSAECQIDRIIAREPNRLLESEAGLCEFWVSEQNDDELQCAGVEAIRHTINPKGLLLPHYTSAPQLAYVVRGRGIHGTVLPGCPETFETSFPSSEGGRQQFFDKHQRVFRYKEGDVIAMPAGAVHWTYNNGETPIVMIVLRDTSNEANQLDRNFREFFLAGNPQNPQQGGQGRRQQEQGQDQASNIFNGFNDEILREVFDVERDTVRQLKGQNDERGLIVRADEFEVVIPDEGEIERGGDNGGITGSICSTKLRADIASPARADVFNPRGGRMSSLNSRKLPILNLLQLSAERGVLYKNAVLSPHYNLNSHSIIYIISGNSRVQIVRSDGSAVFDDVVQEGQLIVVPQDFAVVKKAGEQGCEWVSFKTNENAMTTQLAGRLSFIRSLPEDVLVNSYDISREQAKNLKYNRQEGVVLSPTSSSSRSTSQTAKNALLNVLFS